MKSDLILSIQRSTGALATALAVSWLGSASALAAVTGQWDFNNPANGLAATTGSPLSYVDGPGGATEQGTMFGSTTALGIPDIGGAPAQVMKFPANGSLSQGYYLPNPAAPNGGGSLVNEWTILMDVLFPAESSGVWRALLDVDQGLFAADAEVFLNPGNGLGIGNYFGTVPPNTWHRLGIVVNTPANLLSFYIDGVLVGSRDAGGALALDGRWALTPGGSSILFADNDGEAASGFVNSIQLHDTALSRQQMAALGGPTAEGLPTELPPIPSFVERWIPPGAEGSFAPRTTDIGVVINPGSTTIQDNSIRLRLDGVEQAGTQITRDAGLITVLKPNPGPFAVGSEHTIEVVFTDSLAGQKTFSHRFKAALFFEDFEGLTLRPNKDEALANDMAWTHTPPPGWSIDNSDFPATIIDEIENPDDGEGFASNDGVTEWAGWSFANKDWWTQTAGDQTRSQYALGSGTVAIADPDEWDDLSHAVSLFNSHLKTPPISLEGVAPNTAFLAFASSWRPEALDDANPAKFPVGPNGEAINNQTAIITVSYDGGPPVQVLKWDSIPGSPTFHPDSQSEAVLLPLNNPAGATSMVITFSLLQAANDWWWAIDNVVVSAGATPPLITQQPAGVEVNEGSAVSLSVVASGEGLSYQWFKGVGPARAPIAGATAATYSIASARAADSDLYSVEVSNAVGTTRSNPARLTVLPDLSTRIILLNEDFNSLPLGPSVDEVVPGDQVWTKTPPDGWSIDDTGVPGAGDPDQDGVTEWAGWSFADRAWWAETAGDQQRTLFTKGTGAAAIADSDEWDDVPHAAGNMATYLRTKPISLEGVQPNSVVVKFDSSWRAENPQKANLTVSFDGGAPIEILRFESDQASDFFQADAVNATLVIPVANPPGAQSMVLTFGYFDTRNNWWWAFDNLVVAAEAITDIRQDLVAYLKFEGNYQDASGRGNHGTAVGSPSFGPGKVGQALTYTSLKDGSSFNYVSLGAPADLNFGTATDFTVSFWAKLTSWEGDPAFVANKDWNSGGNQGWVIATGSNGRIQWNIGDGDAGGRTRNDYDSAGGIFNDGQWHHIVVVFDRAVAATTYVDGVPINSTPLTADVDSIDTPAGLATNIGQDGRGTYTDGGSVGVQNGMIDEVAIWRRALKANEVALLFSNGAAGKDITGALPPVGTVTGQWDFDQGDLRATVGAPLQFRGNTAPQTTFVEMPINGQPAKVMGFPKTDPTEGFVMPHGAAPNGGGARVNQYTLIMDLMFPAASANQWRSLWQTNPNNANDGDFFVNPGNGIGISGQYHGVIQPDTWHRVAFAVDLAADPPTVGKYIDGQLVNLQTLSSGRDGRWSLGPTALLFADEDNETQAGFVNSIQFHNTRLSDQAIAALGGASAAGIPLPVTGPGPQIVSVALDAGNLTIRWTGEAGLRLQFSPSLANPNWQDVAGTLGQSSATVPTSGGEGYFRLFKP